MRKALWLPLIALYQVVWAFPVMLAAFVAPNFAYRLVLLWARAILSAAGARVTIEGQENLPPGPVVVMANHQSYLDVPALFDMLPYMLRFVAKRELQYVPFFGWAMKSLGHILINRGQTEQARRSLERGAQQIRDGVSVVIFPEGTRTWDGRLLPFKKGGFVIAIKSGVPILPITIHARDVLPRGNTFAEPGIIHLKVHPPVYTRDYTLDDKEALIEKVRAAVASGL